MTTAEHVRRRQQTAIILGVLNLVALMVVIIVQFAIINPGLARQADDNATSRTALCALRTDLEKRVQQSKKFLLHPNQFPQFNDPKILALTKQQIENQSRTIEALSVLTCD